MNMLLVALASIVVGIVDTGADIQHPVFAHTPVATYNAVDASADVTDLCDHGTGVAGLVVSHAPDVELLVIKVARVCQGSPRALAEGIRYAVDHGAKIIVVTMAQRGASDRLEAAINYARDRDVTVVASVGNDGSDVPVYPSGYEGVIGVGCDRDEYPRSNYGPHVDAIAPCSAQVAAAGGGYHWAMGTSLAAPVVAARLAVYGQVSAPVATWLPWIAHN